MTSKKRSISLSRQFGRKLDRVLTNLNQFRQLFYALTCVDEKGIATFNSTDYENFYGLTHGSLWHDIKENKADLKSVNIRQLFLETEQEKIVEDVTLAIRTSYHNGEYIIEFNKYVLPHILKLSENAKPYILLETDVLKKFKSKYALILYLKLLSLVFRGQDNYVLNYTIDNFKFEMLGETTEYNKTSNFRNRVLMPAVTQINKLTPMNIKLIEITTKGNFDLFNKKRGVSRARTTHIRLIVSNPKQVRSFRKNKSNPEISEIKNNEGLVLTSQELKRAFGVDDKTLEQGEEPNLTDDQKNEMIARLEWGYEEKK